MQTDIECLLLQYVQRGGEGRCERCRSFLPEKRRLAGAWFAVARRGQQKSWRRSDESNRLRAIFCQDKVPTSDSVKRLLYNGCHGAVRVQRRADEMEWVKNYLVCCIILRAVYESMPTVRESAKAIESWRTPPRRRAPRAQTET